MGRILSQAIKWQLDNCSELCSSSRRGEKSETHLSVVTVLYSPIPECTNEIVVCLAPAPGGESSASCQTSYKSDETWGKKPGDLIFTNNKQNKSQPSQIKTPGLLICVSGLPLDIILLGAWRYVSSVPLLLVLCRYNGLQFSKTINGAVVWGLGTASERQEFLLTFIKYILWYRALDIQEIMYTFLYIFNPL